MWVCFDCLKLMSGEKSKELKKDSPYGLADVERLDQTHQLSCSGLRACFPDLSAFKFRE